MFLKVFSRFRGDAQLQIRGLPSVEIAEGTFAGDGSQNRGNLTGVTIPNGVRTIGNRALDESLQNQL